VRVPPARRAHSSAHRFVAEHHVFYYARKTWWIPGLRSRTAAFIEDKFFCALPFPFFPDPFGAFFASDFQKIFARPKTRALFLRASKIQSFIQKIAGFGGIPLKIEKY